MPATMRCASRLRWGANRTSRTSSASASADASSVRINRKLAAFGSQGVERERHIPCGHSSSCHGKRLGPQQKSVGELVGRDPDAERATSP